MRRVKRDWGGGVGDYLKSWDVQLAAQFVSENVKKNSRILDLGCHKSELVLILNALGYNSLEGIDLNAETEFPINPNEFKLHVGDFYEIPIEDESIDCVTQSQ